MSNFINQNSNKMTNDEKRNKVSLILNDAIYCSKIKKYDEAEKYYLKACRIMENVYRQTFSHKDRVLLIECYTKISDFYHYDLINIELVQRWYQKIVGVLQDSCDKYFILDDYRLLLEWDIKTIDLMFYNKMYKKITPIAKKMKKLASVLYQKTKTNEDIKFIILSEMFLADAYFRLNKKFFSYYYYNLAVRKMEKIYQKYYDIGMKNDLIDIYSKLVKLTNCGCLVIFKKRWKIKLGLLKGDKNV